MTPLTGIRVLDLSRVLAGPWATQLLADLGADVIKIERPGTGDDTRSWGPPWLEVPGGVREAAYFLSANRGKRSAAIDISRPDGAAIVRDLAGRSDVMVENFKVGGLARYRLDAATLLAANPQLIIASITGFGQDGPYAGRAGYDFMIQAMGGMMSVTGHADDEAGGGPLRAGVAIADLYTGMYSAIAILAALRERDRTGRGCHIDMALFDVQVAVLANQALSALVSGRSPPRQGNSHPNIVPYQSFAVADGEIIIAVGNDAQFARLAQILGLAALAEDSRFATNSARVENRAALVPLLARPLLDEDRAHWLAALESAGIPAGPINDVLEALGDPQIVHRGMVGARRSMPLGSVPAIGCPILIDGVRPGSDAPPPTLGADSDEVLLELGLGAAAIAALRASGVVG